MKALCQEYRNGARRNEQRNGENDTYRFQRRHNGQRDHAQQPIMQPSRMQTAYLRLLIIKAEQQKSRHFTLITSVTSPAIIIVWIISPMVIPSMSPKRIWSRCTSGLTAIYKIRPAANMPEKTIPITVSCLIRLLSFRYPVATAQNTPATNAPVAKGNPRIRASTMPENRMTHRVTHQCPTFQDQKDRQQRTGYGNYQ